MKGIDCTTAITETSGKALKAAGYEFTARYLVPAAYSWKRLTRTEVAAISGSGLKILSVYETAANRVSGGAAHGAEDGAAAYAEAVAIGQPAGTAIYFACDYDAGISDYDAIEAYLKSAAEKIPGYNTGLYAGFYVVEEMAKRKACRHFWQTYAWSRGYRSAYTNVYQYKNGVVLDGIAVDLNDSYGNEGLWDYQMQTQTDQNQPAENQGTETQPAQTPPVQTVTDWKTIINKISINPEAWIQAITKAVNASNAGIDMGKIDIFKYLPELIEKIYTNK